MELESTHVSRLLELAAAMSSAQEKATGNAKLDMAGIMAALSLAQSDEISNMKKKIGGQNSFLHNSFQKKSYESTSSLSSSSLVRAEYVKETVCEESSEESTTTEYSFKKKNDNNKQEEIATKKSFLHNNGGVKTNSSGNLFENQRKPSGGTNLTEIQISSKKSSNSQVQNDMEDDMKAVRSDANVTKGGNNSFLHGNPNVANSNLNVGGNNICIEEKQQHQYGKNVAGFKAAFESFNNSSNNSESTLSSRSSSNTSLSSIPVQKKQSIPKENDQSQTPTPPPAPGKHLLKSSQSIATFLSKQTNNDNAKACSYSTKDAKIQPSIDAEKFTKREESKACFDIGSKKAIFESSNESNSVANSAMKMSQGVGSRLKRGGGREKRLTNLFDSSDDQVSKFIAKVAELSAEKEKNTGNAGLDMTELAAALSSVTEVDEDEGDASSFLEHNEAAAKRTSHESWGHCQQRKEEESVAKTRESHTTNSSQTASAGAAVSTRQFVQSSVASSQQAKSSFLQSTLGHGQQPTPHNIKVKTDEGRENFTPEKNSVIDELKSVMNEEAATPSHASLPRKSFNSTAKGYQRPPGQIQSSEQMVNKIVYNQYREMLNSYNNNNQAK